MLRVFSQSALSAVTLRRGAARGMRMAALGVWLVVVMWLGTGTCAAAAESIAAAQTAPRAGKVLVHIKGVEGELLSNIKGYLEIWQFHNRTIESAARVQYLHRAAQKQIKKALQPFGYYKPVIESQLARKGGVWEALYRIQPGPKVLLHRLDLQISGAGKNDPAFAEAIQKAALREGEPLDQAAYEALKKRFQVLASERGYFDAVLKAHEIRIDLRAYTAEVRLHFSTGPRYRLGKVEFTETQPWLARDFLQRYVEIEPGQPYAASALQRLQGDLSNSDYYKQVEIVASPEQADADRIIPVVVKLEPRPKRKYVFGAGYGTDTGARIKAGITGRRVNRQGHHYQAEALVSQISYGIGGEYIIPGRDPRSDAYGLRASYTDEHSETRNFQALNLGGYYQYRQGLWTKTYALDYRVERYRLEADTVTSKLLIPSLDWTRTNPGDFEKRIYAEHGAWLQLKLRGGHDALLSDTTFVQPMIAAKWIRAFGNHTRVIGRAAGGTTWVSDFGSLPTSLRFFTGGDRTVRGYKYNVIGPPRSPTNLDTDGGKHLLEASLEYEVPIGAQWSVAAFVDTGDAFNNTPDYKTGVGLGLHWRSPIGPVRIDFGHALDQPLGNVLLLHLNIGPDL